MKPSVLIVLSNGVSDIRMEFAAQALTRAGHAVEIMSAVPMWTIAMFDVFIVSRPGLEMCDFCDNVFQSQRPLIVDMDDDFTTIPPHSPAYKVVGPGRGGYIKRLMHTIQNTTVMTTTNTRLAAAYERPDAVIVPNGYDAENTYWQASGPNRDMLTIGWAGSLTHREDFRTIENILHAILQERKNVQVIIGADYEIYRQFKPHLPKQRLYFPGMTYQDYPLMLSWWDILLAPLEDIPFNAAKSDIKLVEAGAKSIPWIASPIPSYQEWKAGGILASTPGDWYQAINTLLDNPELRRHLGDQGHAQAVTRAATVIGEQWVALVDQLKP